MTNEEEKILTANIQDIRNALHTVPNCTGKARCFQAVTRLVKYLEERKNENGKMESPHA